MYVQYVLRAYFDVTKRVGHIPREISRHVYFFIKKKEGCINGKVLSVKYQPSPIPSAGLEIPMILKFNCSKSGTFLKMKQLVNELFDYEFTGNVKIEQNEDEEEIPKMVIDEDQYSSDEKTEEEMEDFSKPLVSFVISNDEEIETIVV